MGWKIFGFTVAVAALLLFDKAFEEGG